jgi:hypothetical protein
MNSAAALMKSHNIVNPNSILESARILFESNNLLNPESTMPTATHSG